MKYRYISALLVSLLTSGMAMAVDDSWLTTSGNLGVSYSNDTGFIVNTWSGAVDALNYYDVTTSVDLGIRQIGSEWYQSTRYTRSVSYDDLYQNYSNTTRSVSANFETVGSGDQWVELNLSTDRAASYYLEAHATSGTRTSPRGNVQSIFPASGVVVDGVSSSGEWWQSTLLHSYSFGSGSLNNSLQLVVEATDGGLVDYVNVSFSTATIAGNTFTVHYDNPVYDQWDVNARVIYAPVPEPESYAMLLAGMGLIGGIARRRKLVL